MTRSKLVVLFGSAALLLAFLPINRQETRDIKRIRASVAAAEAPLRKYENVPVEELAAALPSFEAIDTTGAPAQVSHALQAYIAALCDCIQEIRKGDSIQASQASRDVEEAQQAFHAALNTSRGAPF